ncbi:Protein of unknown function DUF3511 [Dillenia turbinata]|uniref:Uncharacterized protein n=1 Tax=Dillenia turbinata TaxID=194707 RepID=A0AAN8VT36_9MAGN
MSEFSSKSYGGDRRMEIVVSGRTSSSSSVANQIYMTRPRSPDLPPIPPPRLNQRTSHETTSSLPWSFNDPEMKRKKRVAKYKVYAVEGRVKASLRRGLRWSLKILSINLKSSLRFKLRIAKSEVQAGSARWEP